MTLVEDLKTALANFAGVTSDAAELARLQQFLTEMTTAGVAKTREYDLPQPDTIGRAAKNVAPRSHLTRR